MNFFRKKKENPLYTDKARNQYIRKTCQDIATRTPNPVAAMAAYHAIPFKRDVPYREIVKLDEDEPEWKENGLPRTKNSDHAAVNGIVDLAPMFADIYDVGSTSGNLKQIIKGYKTYEEDIYEDFAKLSTALVYSLADKENTSIENVYHNLKDRLFDERDKNSEQYKGFIHAGHMLGIEGEPYLTQEDVFTTLYGSKSQTSSEKRKALKSAKDLYIQSPENEECLFALVDNGQPIAGIVKDAPKNITVRRAIESIKPEYTPWLEDMATEQQVEDTHGNSKLIDTHYDKGKAIYTVNTGESQKEVDSLVSNFESFHELREDLKAWYGLIRQDEIDTESEKILFALSEKIGNQGLGKQAMQNITEVLIAQTQKNPDKEYQALQRIEQGAKKESHWGRYGEETTLYFESDSESGITGFGTFDRRKSEVENQIATEKENRTKALGSLSQLSPEAENAEIRMGGLFGR